MADAAGSPERGIATWTTVFAASMALITALSAAACLVLIGFLGPIIVLPLSLATFTAVGLLLVLHRPTHPIGWLFLAAGAAWTVSFAAPAYAWRALVEAPGGLPAGEVAAWLGEFAIFAAAAATVIAVMLFPTGRPASRIWGAVIVVVGASLALTMAVAAFAPEPIALQRPWFPGDAPATRPTTLNPFAAGGPVGTALLQVEPALQTVTGVPVVLLMFAATAARFMRASEVERHQLKWFAYAASFSIVLLTAGFVLPRSIAGNVAWASGMVALGFIPVGAGLAVLRYRLYEIDVLISRTMSYAALSAMLVALYLITATSLGALLGQPDEPVVSAAAALAVAILLNPLRIRIQRAVDHLVYGEREDPYAIVSKLGRRLGEALEPESVLPTVARTVARSLRLPYVGIELTTADGDRIVASHGTPGERTIRLPLVYQQDTLGHLIASPRTGEPTLGHRDREVLDALSRQAGVVAHGVRVTEELRRARERVLVATEEERHRLLRDLHDELGPRLASHTLIVDAARMALTRDAARADALLAELARDTRQSSDEVRRIARGLRPPALDELGLCEAVRDAATQCASGALAVEVDVTHVEPTPTAVETAAYHVAREALANVVRHADAKWCAVRLRSNANGELVLEVEDDGKGIAPGASAGIGFQSMRERPAEVGGRCVIGDRPGGGTRVTALFPLGARA